MQLLNRHGLWVRLVCFIFAGCTPVADQQGSDDTTIYLVRHAEKVLNVTNPELSEAGKQRAETLARDLAGAGISRIHSTQYKRTLQTAGPLARDLSIEIEIYDPDTLDQFAESVGRTGETHLIVGHSNTTPQLVEAFGGVPGADIDEASEYDRLYVVQIDPDGIVDTELRRYGEPYDPAP